MRIATFNCNSVRTRLNIILKWISENDPDVLCLQETKTIDKDFPADAFTKIGYYPFFRGEKAYNGVAILSRIKPSKVSFGFADGKQRDETRLAQAQINSIYIVNTYVPQGRLITHEMYQYKLNWFKRLKEYFASHFSPDNKVVWLGDLNIAPENIDIHNAEKQANHVCFHIDARNAFNEVIAWGFIDIFRKYHKGPGHYTFFDYRIIDAVKKNMGWRCLLYTSPSPRDS